MRRNIKPWERSNNMSSSNELLGTLQSQSTGLEAPPIDPQTANMMSEEREKQALVSGSSQPLDNPSGLTQASTELQTGARTGGSLGGYGSGYGSSLGGYGGLGGMGMGGLGGMGMGMGMGMGGMGMYGRYGGAGMMGMDENSSFLKSMQFMESMSFVINSMCEVVRMLETNTEGLLHLWGAVVNLFKKSKDWMLDTLIAGKDKMTNIVFRMLVYLHIEKDNGQSGGENKEEKEAEIESYLTEEEAAKLRAIRKKKRVYKFLMKASVVVVLCCILYFYKNGRIVTRVAKESTSRVSESVVNAGASDSLDKAFEALKN